MAYLPDFSGGRGFTGVGRFLSAWEPIERSCIRGIRPSLDRSFFPLVFEIWLSALATFIGSTILGTKNFEISSKQFEQRITVLKY